MDASGRPGAALRRLPGAIRSVLEEALAAGGSSLRDHRQADGAPGYFQHSFRVYDRAGAPCPTLACNGRIDRKLQRSPVVHCYYFVFLQRPEDHVLKVLVRRTLTIQDELGSQGKVIEARLASLLEGGIRHRERDQLAHRLDQAEHNARLKEKWEDELDRRRAEQINEDLRELEKILGKSRDYLHLDEGALQAALRASLRIAGAWRKAFASCSQSG